MSSRFELPVTQPFDWPSLMAFLQVRATPGVEAVRDGVYTRTFGTPEHPGTLSVRYDAVKSCLRVEHSGSPGDEKQIAPRIRQIFRTGVDTAPIEKFLQKDRWLRGFIRQRPGLRVPGGWTPFEIALRAVMGQQVSVPAATTLMGRLMRLAATWSDDSACVFPSPEQVMSADISRLGMPGKRIETLRALSRFFVEREAAGLPSMEELVVVPGIGRWTAGYILMRAAHEAGDHWPEGDLVLRKALSPGEKMVSHVVMARMFEQWSPWRSYATLHIWKGYDGTNSRPE
ncbi:MAG: hypothetical protein LAP21_18845 [Acidobacteriia bacterium]|nr:hypothetical protein [Terriglobia bacterium]